MKVLRAISFEITGTLVCMQVPLGQVYSDALRHYRLPAPNDDLMKAAFKRAYVGVSKELPMFGASDGMNERGWWDVMIRRTLEEAECGEALEADTFPLVFQRIYSAFGSPDVWAACPDGVAAMRHAKQRGLTVGAVCNAYHRYVDNNLPLLGLHADLDFSALSLEVGVAKPDPKLFDAARLRASHASRLLYGRELPEIAPHEMLHVGDDLTNDYLAAKACGMHALLLDPKRVAAHDSLTPDDVISSLAEVPAKIDALTVRD